MTNADNAVTPTLAIITPVRGQPQSLRRCLASVDRQREGLAIEHVIVDGGALAASPELDGQGRIWLRGPDRGIYDALNNGIAQSQAPIIGQLNADEQSLPGALAFALERFARDPGLELLFGDYILVDAQGRPLAARREIPVWRGCLRHGVNSILSCATFFRRSLWERVGPFDATLRLLGDKDWYLRALDGGVRCAHVARYLALFALTADNASGDVQRAGLEQAEVRRRHGGAERGLRRVGARYWRWTLKALMGAYGLHQVRYEYCRENGRVDTFRAWTGSRWPAQRARPAPTSNATTPDKVPRRR